MGIEHILQNLDASELNIGYSPLIPQGLEYLNFFGGSAPVGRNLAPGKPQATVIGMPSVGSMAEGITTRYLADYIQTPVDHTTQMTILVVAKGVAEGEHFVVSNYTNARTNLSLRVRTPSNISGQSKVVVDAVTAYRTAAGQNNAWGNASPAFAINEFQAIAMRHDYTPVTGKVMVNQLTTGYAGATTSGRPADSEPNLGGKLRLGSGYDSFFTPKTPGILFAAMWSRVLSDAELKEQYAQLKAFYASAKGVAI